MPGRRGLEWGGLDSVGQSQEMSTIWALDCVSHNLVFGALSNDIPYYSKTHRARDKDSVPVTSMALSRRPSRTERRAGDCVAPSGGTRGATCSLSDAIECMFYSGKVASHKGGWLKKSIPVDMLILRKCKQLIVCGCHIHAVEVREVRAQVQFARINCDVGSDCDVC